MKLRPLMDRIVVKRLEAEEKTKGGLFIPDSAKEKPVTAKVLAVGNGKLLKNGKIRPLEIKVGDVVLLDKYHFSEIKLDGEEVTLVREDDVLAVEV